MISDNGHKKILFSVVSEFVVCVRDSVGGNASYIILLLFQVTSKVTHEVPFLIY